MKIKNIANLFFKTFAPFAVGVAGSGVGIWWLLYQKKLKLEEKFEEINEDYENIEIEHRELSETNDKVNKDLKELALQLESVQSQIKQLESEKTLSEKERTELLNKKSQIEGEVKELKTQKQEIEAKISEKSKELLNHEEKIKRHQEKIEERDREISELTKNSSELEGKIQELIKGNITNLKTQISEWIQKLLIKKSTVEQQKIALDSEQNRLDLKTQEFNSQAQTIQEKTQKLEEWERKITLQNIKLESDYKKFLSDNAPDYDFSKPINFKKIGIVSFGENGSTLKIRNKAGQEIEMKFNKKNDELKKIDSLLQEIKTTGFKYQVKNDSFQKWDKKINLNFYEQQLENYKEGVSWWQIKSSTKELDLSKIFRNEHLKDVALILMAIESVSTLGVKKNQDGSFEFAWTLLKQNTNTQHDVVKNFYTYMFSNEEDFTKYLIVKNYEYQTTKKLDLSDLLNPALRSESYKQIPT